MQTALGGGRVARDTIDLFNAVTSAAGRQFCVDSSKSPFRFRAVFDREPESTLAVVLVRDYRAVVHSKMKRGQALEKAAAGWRRKMVEIDALTSDLSIASVHHLKYESLCIDPERELQKLCLFLGIEYSTAMLERSVENLHHIGGSPSKFDPSRSRISLDRSYEQVFTQDALRQIRAVIRDAADKWGY